MPKGRSSKRPTWHATKTIEDTMPSDTPGCADGFKLDAETGLLLASCAGGLCIVDTDAGEVIARLHTAEQGWRVSNTAIVDGTVYLTTERGIWTLPLNPSRVPAAAWPTHHGEEL